MNLLGIDSVMQPYDNRVRTWQRIAADLPHDKLAAMTEVTGLNGIADAAGRILQGKIRGRLVVDLRA